MTAAATLAPLLAPPCPWFCVHCINEHTAPGTDRGSPWHNGPTFTITDEHDGNPGLAEVTAERMDGRYGQGQVRIRVDAQGSLSPAKARELIAALTAQVTIAEQHGGAP